MADRGWLSVNAVDRWLHGRLVLDPRWQVFQEDTGKFHFRHPFVVYSTSFVSLSLIVHILLFMLHSHHAAVSFTTQEEAALLGAYKTVIDGKALKPLIEWDMLNTSLNFTANNTFQILRHRSFHDCFTDQTLFRDCFIYQLLIVSWLPHRSDIADVVPAALIKAEHMSEFKWVRHISAKMTSVANLHVVECRSRFIGTCLLLCCI